MDHDDSSNGSNDSSVNLDIGSPEPPENRVTDYIKSPDPETLDTGSMDGPESPEETPMSPDETPMSPDEAPMSPDETPMSPDVSQSADDASRSSMGGPKSIDRPHSPEDNPRSPSLDNPRSPSPDNNISSSLDNPRSPSPDNIRSLSPDNLQSPSPGTNIRSPSPGINVRSPSPGANVRSPSPGINVRSPSPGINVRSPSPRTNVRSPSPGVNVRSPSFDDNPRSPSPDNQRSPSPNLRSRSSTFDNSGDEVRGSTLQRSNLPKSSEKAEAFKGFMKLEPTNTIKDKPMDSKTVETLEGELDFEEEVQEKEEESVVEDKEISQISDESVKADEKKGEESKSSKSKERKLIKMDDAKIKPEKNDQEEGEADDGEVTDEDDLEEGEVKDGASTRKGFPRPNCRFFNKGQCTWGSSCRFIHPGVNDKGNYNMFAPSKPSMGANMMMMPGPPPPMPPPMPMMKMPPLPPHPRMRPMMGPEYRPFPPHEEPPPVESAWERGLRHAKEIMKKATRRKEQESDFEDKRMNLSIENPDRLYSERDLDKYGPSYRRPGESGFFKDELDDPYDTLEDRDIQERWRGGHYENFEVRWNRPDFDREFHDKDRQRRYPRSMEREKFERRSPEADRWQDERYREAQAPRGRADEWSDPWRRSKTPKGRRSRSQARSGRRSYSSGSSRSYSSSSSRSSFDSRSSYSKSSRFSSERSRSRSHPRVPSRESRQGYRYNKSPPGGVRTFERDLYESRRRAPPQAAGSRDPLMRSPTLARNSSPPTRPPIGRGPSPVHKIVDISPLNKFSPSRRSPPPRKMASSPVAKKQQPKIMQIDLSPPTTKRGQYPPEGKQKPRKSPIIDRKKAKVGPKSPSPLSPPTGGRLGDVLMPKVKENRKHPATHVPKGPVKLKTDYRTRKSRSGSHTGSDSSRSLSRSLSRSSHSSSRSRSRSRSLSRSVSMSSVSSVSSSISHSSSGSDVGKPKGSKSKSSSKSAIPPGLRRPPAEKPVGKKEATLRIPQEGKVKERVTKEAKRTHDRHFTEFDDHPKGSSGYEDPRGTPTSLTIPLMVSKQSKDLIKQSGQKAPIKLNLLSKAQKQTTLDKSPVKADGRKHGDRGDDGNRGVKSAPVVSSVGSRKRPASPSHKKASASSIAAAKATNSRREELLKQLKAVEDAIARKKSKPN